MEGTCRLLGVAASQEELQEGEAEGRGHSKASLLQNQQRGQGPQGRGQGLEMCPGQSRSPHMVIGPGTPVHTL